MLQAVSTAALAVFGETGWPVTPGRVYAWNDSRIAHITRPSRPLRLAQRCRRVTLGSSGRTSPCHGSERAKFGRYAERGVNRNPTLSAIGDKSVSTASARACSDSTSSHCGKWGAPGSAGRRSCCFVKSDGGTNAPIRQRRCPSGSPEAGSIGIRRKKIISVRANLPRLSHPASTLDLRLAMRATVSVLTTCSTSGALRHFPDCASS
jgi:hypothetical protein